MATKSGAIDCVGELTHIADSRYLGKRVTNRAIDIVSCEAR